MQKIQNDPFTKAIRNVHNKVLGGLLLDDKDILMLITSGSIYSQLDDEEIMEIIKGARE